MSSHTIADKHKVVTIGQEMFTMVGETMTMVRVGEATTIAGAGGITANEAHRVRGEIAEETGAVTIAMMNVLETTARTVLMKD